MALYTEVATTELDRLTREKWTKERQGVVIPRDNGKGPDFSAGLLLPSDVYREKSNNIQLKKAANIDNIPAIVNPLKWKQSLEPYAFDLFTNIVTSKSSRVKVRVPGLCVSSIDDGLAVLPHGILTMSDGKEELVDIDCLTPEEFYQVGVKWEPTAEHKKHIDVMFYALGIYKCHYFAFCPLVEEGEPCFLLMEYEWKEEEREEKAREMKELIERQGISSSEEFKQKIAEFRKKNTKNVEKFANADEAKQLANKAKAAWALSVMTGATSLN